MNTIKVKDLMVPSAQCPRVSQEATLREAVLELEATRSRGDPWDYRPRVILVLDNQDNIVGTLRQFDILKALEPKYHEVAKALEPKYRQTLGSPAAAGEQADEIKMLFCMGQDLEVVRASKEDYGLWSESLSDMSRRASRIKVTKIMSIPGDADVIDHDEPVSEALHKMIMGNQQSLVVKAEGHSVGIIRLIDIFNEACSAIKLCPV